MFMANAWTPAKIQNKLCVIYKIHTRFHSFNDCYGYECWKSHLEYLFGLIAVRPTYTIGTV